MGCSYCNNSTSKKEKLLLQDAIDEYKSPSSTNGCQIEECVSLEKILNALLYYEWNNAVNTNRVDMLIKYCTNEYDNIINDFNHIILKHYNDMDDIHKYIKTNFNRLGSCNLTKCNIYKRSNRNRERIINGNKRNKQITSNPQFLFWRDLMDQIHGFLIHLFDSSLRIIYLFSISRWRQ